LCEYEVEYTAFVSSHSASNSTSNTNNREALMQQCKQSFNGMEFSYLFALSLLFALLDLAITLHNAKRRL